MAEAIRPWVNSANAPRTIESVIAPGSIWPRERSPERLGLAGGGDHVGRRFRTLDRAGRRLGKRIVDIGARFGTGNRRHQAVDHGLVARLGAAARLNGLQSFRKRRGIARRIEDIVRARPWPYP